MMPMTTGKGGACCAQTLASVPLFHRASWVEDIVQDIHGLLANYNTPQTSTCAPYNFKGAPPPICQNLRAQIQRDWTEIQKTGAANTIRITLRYSATLAHQFPCTQRGGVRFP